MTSQVENTGTETRAVETVYDGEIKTNAGQLGLFSRLGQHWTVRLSGDIRQVRTDAAQSDASAILYGSKYDRDSQDVRFQVVNTGLNRTRLQLDYRFRKTTLEKTVSEGNLPGSVPLGDWQAQDQDKTEHRVDFRARHRCSSKAKLDLRMGWMQQDVEAVHTWDTTDGDAGFYTMGDRKISRFSGQLMFKTKPMDKVRLDVGYRGFSRTFERTDLENVDTTWQAHRGMLNLNWIVHEKVTFYSMVSYGIEKYELSNDPVTSGTMGAVLYDGTTIRFMPGVNVQLLPKLNLEAMYEGIRFQDAGNESDNLNKIEADHDRMLARARYSINDKYAAAVTYQRREFFEHRWDNYIHDVYSVSLSGRF